METKGKWEILNRGFGIDIVSSEDSEFVAHVFYNSDIDKMKTTATLICETVNACKEVSSNPLAAAKGYKEIVEALRDLLKHYRNYMNNTEQWLIDECVTALANIESKE